MIPIRVMPVLLIEEGRLVKGEQFTNHRYVGDPMNAIRIYSAKEVDELILLDIGATRKKSLISIDFVRKVSSECLMPFTVGGGICNEEQVKQLLAAGAEKAALGAAAVEKPGLIRRLADSFGSQSIVVSIDVRKSKAGHDEVLIRSGTKVIDKDPVSLAQDVEKQGAGEILLNSIDRDGTQMGYDLERIRKVADAVNIPVIALGGAGKNSDLRSAVVEGRASAVAAGSFFVFHGQRRAVLINFPTRQELNELFA
ncbi:MAG: imidazole glycerol phosphate synthase subunit HisF [Deltaproteobacteria bacterium]|nr:imidazole glycerol phosphate synthase subunit HisF [Deltaproteobacteria bacterium]